MRGTETRLLIATAAGILALMILAWAAFDWVSNAPARIEIAAAKQIEDGATVYDSHCASCHGRFGRSEFCYNAGTGTLNECMGSPLYSQEFYCRYSQTEGPTMGQFIDRTFVSRGNTADEIASHEIFTELTGAERRAVTAYVINWYKPLIPSCEPTPEPVPPTPTADLRNTIGDIENGENLYNTYRCEVCHGNLDDANTARVGPWLGQMSQPDYLPPVAGYTPADYLLESIVDPSAYISDDCPTGPCSGPPSEMPVNFGRTMTIEKLADVMAYILQSSELLDLTED